jgi:hypothetical protein
MIQLQKVKSRAKNISTNRVNRFELQQNFPNPFNPKTVIKYQVFNRSNVVIKIYDILGKEVITLVNMIQMPGSYVIGWNATNYSSGIYFYKMTAENFLDVKKMILIK